MALRLTFPQSAAIDPNTIAGSQIRWETDEQGQVAYELQYKLKKDKYWSTCGKVYDKEADYCSFEPIFNICPVEFYEIMYRIVIYLEGPNIDQYTGKEGMIHSTLTSDAYWLIFMSEAALELKVSPDGEGWYTYPLVDSITEESHELAEVESVKVNVGTDSAPQTKILPLVQLDSPIAGELKVSTPTGIKVAMTAAPHFRDTREYAYGYVDQYVKDYQTIYKYTYGPAYDYLAIYKYETVYQHDPVYLYEPHYETLYDYKQYYAIDIYYYEYSYYYPNYNTHSYTTYWTDYYPVYYTAYGSYTYSYSYKVYYTYTYSSAVQASYAQSFPVTYAYNFFYTEYVPAQYKPRYRAGYSVGKVTTKYGSTTGYRTVYYYYYQNKTGTGSRNASGTSPGTYAYTASYTASEQKSSTYTYYSIASYTFVPSAYRPDYYTVYSYDPSYESMYVRYTYYNLDYYYAYDTGTYNIYVHHYYDYIDRYITYYSGMIQYTQLDYYTDISYSYNYTING